MALLSTSELPSLCTLSILADDDRHVEYDWPSIQTFHSFVERSCAISALFLDRLWIPTSLLSALLELLPTLTSFTFHELVNRDKPVPTLTADVVKRFIARAGGDAPLLPLLPHLTHLDISGIGISVDCLLAAVKSRRRAMNTGVIREAGLAVARIQIIRVKLLDTRVPGDIAQMVRYLQLGGCNISVTSSSETVV
jgi:hypothetical protein